MTHAIAHNTPVLNGLLAAVNTAFEALVAKLVVSTKKVQIARMSEALHHLDDAQLAHIGITRREIPDYANMIIRVHG